MANKTLSMQKIRQILLFLMRGYSEREIVKQTGISRPTVHLYACLFQETGKDHDTLLSLKDSELKALFGKLKSTKAEPEDPRKIHFILQVPYFISELKRVGVTRYLLWQEYLEPFPGGYQYSRFCELLDAEMARRKPTMHFNHNAGELLEIDFAGSKLQYITDDGEVIECPVLVAVLPFSGYTYLRALPNASLPHLIHALNEMLGYFGGVPMNAISDNMKQWVSRTSRYEPTFPDMIQAWAQHNRIGILATRPVAPKDKASVEGSVLIAYRRVYALLRNDTFRSLGQLNKGIADKLELHHLQNFQKKTYSRKELFTTQEQPLLAPLPESSYQLRHYTKAKVQKNYHVVLGEDWHFYSVPYTYLGKEVNLVYCSDHLEIYYQLERIAIHTRSYKKHGYTTSLDHMPENHRKLAEQRGWNPEYYLARALENGPFTHEFFLKLMESKITIHQAYAPCLGILRMMASYSGARVEAACKRALRGNKYNYGVIETILKNNMDLHEDRPAPSSPIPAHTNLRGAIAYKDLFDSH
jgi:transposase